MLLMTSQQLLINTLSILVLKKSPPPSEKSYQSLCLHSNEEMKCCVLKLNRFKTLIHPWVIPTASSCQTCGRAPLRYTGIAYVCA
jgi:hypothetical protein